MAEDFIYSRNALLKAKKPDGIYYPFAFVEEMGITIRTGVLETTTVGNGGWESHVYSKLKGWDATLRGVASIQHIGCWTVPEIIAALTGHTVLDLQFLLMDTGAHVITYSGIGLLPELAISASVGDGSEAAKWNMTIKGTGVLGSGSIVVVPMPVLSANDSANTLSATASSGTLYVSENSGAWMVYSSTISVGDVARAYGYWRFKATLSGVDSAISYSPAFTASIPGSPATPVVTANDGANTLSATASSGTLYVSENNGAWVTYTSAISVGNVARAAGYWKFRATNGSIYSNVVNSPAFTYTAPGACDSVVTGINITAGVSGSANLSWTATGSATYFRIIVPAYTTHKLGTSDTVNLLPGQTVTIIPICNHLTTPVEGTSMSKVWIEAPVVTANDTDNSISASNPNGFGVIWYKYATDPWALYSGPMSVLAVDLPAGEFKFKIVNGADESAIVNSPAFTAG